MCPYQEAHLLFCFIVLKEPYTLSVVIRKDVEKDAIITRDIIQNNNKAIEYIEDRKTFFFYFFHTTKAMFSLFFDFNIQR